MQQFRGHNDVRAELGVSPLSALLGPARYAQILIGKTCELLALDLRAKPMGVIVGEGDQCRMTPHMLLLDAPAACMTVMAYVTAYVRGSPR